MLKTLILHNLVLVKRAEVDFEKGFSAITGETGAGKTALIEAIRLILGERADASKVRKGADKASIQASFSVEPTKLLLQLFEDAGLLFPKDEELLLTREISASGKGRAFACGQMVPAAFLQKIAPHLVDFIGQHAQIELKSESRQRTWLDLYGEIDLEPFNRAWSHEKKILSDLETLLEEKAMSAKKTALLTEQIQELTDVGISEGEDEALFEEYTIKSNARELLIHSEQALGEVENSRQSTANALSSLHEMDKFEVGLSEVSKMANESQLLLEEIQMALQSFQSKLESDPARLTFLEERLKLIDLIKKKYGKTPLTRLQEMQEELKAIDTLGDREEALKSALEKGKKETNLAASHIKQLRTKGARELGEKLSKTLQNLNIPNAKLQVEVRPATRTKEGDDEIAFYLCANKGEHLSPVKESSSGGELSRLLFALKLALAEKNHPSTMIFDEIDANVGGQTATLIGGHLKELSSHRQVLCITHFPQVASQADHHICVSKHENTERTEGQISTLSKKEKEIELLRMLGGQTV
ncbi:MAG: AAA family ATPase [Simkaniaceae bacterium]|nr:AAA family ATPase [Candidatus Sacchlamyda saccharinae]